MLKSITVAALGAGLLFTASLSFAGRYGDDEVRHWQQIKKLQEAKQGLNGVEGRKADGKEAAMEPNKILLHKCPRS